jgi:RNA polymerase sigma factor (sigma-70 family)
MASTPLGAVVRHIRKLAGAPVARTTPVQLLRRFADEQNEDAFAELMRRHGPLVLSVCRRVLGHEQDAEDAFQAAFLVLARKAASIRKGESVGSFLYGVAYRIAMKERTKHAGRRQREREVGQPAATEPVYEAAWRELQVILDEGLNHLPEKYRVPFVLCCLEGKSKSEAARELDWKEGTVSSRLAHARKELQQFLSRKGVTLSAAMAAVGIAENTASAYVPPLLAASCVRAATLFASGSIAALETVKAVQLAEALLRSMAALPWKMATALLMVVCLAAGGAGLAHHAEAAKQAAASEPPKATPSAPRKQARTEEKPRTDRYGDPLPEGALARLGTIRFRQGFLMYRAVFSLDGKTIAAAAAGGGVCLWDAITGKERRRFGPAAYANAVAFSPDGKALACVFNSKENGLYETATGRKIADLPNGVGALAYAPDGKTLAAVIGPGRAIHLFDAASGEKRKQEVTSARDDMNRLAWSPDSKKLAWVGADISIHLCDANKGEEIVQWKAHEKNISDVAFSPDGKMLASASEDATIRLWDVVTQEKIHTLDGKHQRVRTVIFSRDGRMLASGHGDGTIALWDVAKGEEIRRWQAHTFMVASLDFSPDGKTLVSGASWECGPRLWDVATGEEVRAFAGHTSTVDHLMFSPDGKRILSLGREKKILDWDLASERETVRFQLPFHAASRTLDYYALSPRGDIVASWSFKDDTIRLWDMAAGKERQPLGKFARDDKDTGFFAPLKFSPDGRLLAFGTKDRVVSVWDVAAGVERQRLKGLAGTLHCLAFSRDGQKIAAGSVRAGSDTIGLWDITTGKSLVKFSSTEQVDKLAFSPNSKILASASWTGDTTRLWDATTGRQLRSLAGAPPVYDLAFSPDGKWLAGAGEDKDQKVHVWEANSGLEMYCFRGHHAGGVMSVAFAPDGRTLASGGGDSSILLWDLTGRLKDGRLRAAKWTRPELEQRWRDLANPDGKRAVQALWDLVADPEQAVPMLRQRIKPAPAADAKHIERLIRDLDSEDFETRTKATEELEKLVESAEPVLRKKLADKPSLEVRQRIKHILSKLEPSSPERLRELRAIQVLEYAGTAEAKECLRTWVKDVAYARLAREAEASLERLAKK